MAITATVNSLTKLLMMTGALKFGTNPIKMAMCQIDGVGYERFAQIGTWETPASGTYPAGGVVLANVRMSFGETTVGGVGTTWATVTADNIALTGVTGNIRTLFLYMPGTYSTVINGYTYSWLDPIIARISLVSNSDGPVSNPGAFGVTWPDSVVLKVA